MTEDELNAFKKTIFAAYEAQGFARELVGEWAISENDVADFLDAAKKAAPKRILEVGTYVGVSTMMLALHCPEAEIFTVDPDFPLAKEMLAVGSKREIATGSATHHSIARAAAESLGVLDRIHFFKGGFSVGDTFASSLGDIEAKVDVVGPALCKEHGPFDFAFIDGLHTSDAVLKDIELCAANIVPGAPIVLHDCIGFWGASVRRGVFEFLCRQPEFRFAHASYKDVYRSIGVVQTENNTGFDTRAPEAPSPALKSIIKSISDRVFGDNDYAELTAGGAFTKAPQLSLDTVDSANIIAIEAVDFFNHSALQTFFTAIAGSNGVALLGATPPGEQGVAGPQSRPLARLLEIAENTGLNLFIAPFTDHEHGRYSLLPEPRELGLTSKFLTFLVATPQETFTDATGRNYVRLSRELAHEHEQAELQRAHLAAAFRKFYALNLKGEKDAAELRFHWQTAIDSAKQEQRIRFEAVEQLTRQIDANAEEARHQQELHAEATEELKRQQQLRAEAAEELRRQQQLHDETVNQMKLEAEALMRRLSEVNGLNTELDSKLAAAERRANTFVSELVAAYGVLESIDGNLTTQAEMIGDSASATKTAVQNQDHSGIAASEIKDRSASITTLIRSILTQAAESASDFERPIPSTIYELGREYALLRDELQRIRRSFSWRILGFYRKPRRFVARLIGR